MTKKKRHEYYKKLLEVVCADPDTDIGFCWYIAYAMEKFHFIWAYDSKTFKKELPELFSYKPHNPNYSVHWFNTDKKGWQKRINILMECIEKTKKIK
jgi:hypothetical protein